MSEHLLHQLLSNKSDKTLVFSLTERGFSSEINNLLSAILFCLLQNLAFKLSTQSWCALYQYGWQDYFNPFCEETNNILFRRKSVFRDYKKLNFIQKCLLKNHLNVRDIWDIITSKKFLTQHFSILELGINGDIFHAKRTILKQIYRLNTQTQLAISTLSQKIDTSKPYIGLHIRRGDKITNQESEEIELKKYHQCIQKASPSIKRIFIATDDYTVIDEFKNVTDNHYSIQTLCPKSQQGHHEDDFNQLNPLRRKSEIIRLLADLQLLIHSDIFIGTYSSNIGRLIALFKGQENCFSVDLNSWHPF